MENRNNHVSEFNDVPSPLEYSDFGYNEDKPRDLLQLVGCFFSQASVLNPNFVPQFFKLSEYSSGQSKLSYDIGAVSDHGLVKLDGIDEVLHIVDEIVNAITRES